METNIQVHKTSDYGIFRFLEENRDITEPRVNKIIKSINTVGYVLSPILVNEKMEIIDGQGRFMALKKLGLPQYYIMQEGLGIKECRQMNIHQTNWTAMDYIKSYAKSGNENYQRLQSLIDSTTLGFGTVVGIVLGRKYSGGACDIVKNGELVLSSADKEIHKWVIGYTEKFIDVAKKIGGRTDYFYLAVAYAYRNLEIDQRNALEEVIRKNVFNIPPFNSILEYLKYFDAFYNSKKKSEKNKIHLEMQYRLDNM